MAPAKEPELRPADIGERVRMIRKRRGMSLAVAAGLAGISKPYLSLLERGERRFDKRSTITRIADALGCSVVDLTDEPYVPADRASAEAMTAIPQIRLALLDCTLDDVPDVPTRPIEQLARMVSEANAHRDQAAYALAGQDIGPILTELQVTIANSTGDIQRAALTALVEASFTAYELAKNFGYPELGLEAARRGYEAARRLEDPSLIGMTTWFRVLALQRLGVHRRVTDVLAEAIEQLEPVADPGKEHSTSAEAYGLLHLIAGLHAARLGNPGLVHDHVAEAAHVAERTGECNSLRTHFGPTNVAAWRISIGIELEEGAKAYEKAMAGGLDVSVFGARNRASCVYLDLARALAQEGGARDWDATRHLDQADQLAPYRVRHDPIARELLAELDNRARIRSWELKSLRHRFGWN